MQKNKKRKQISNSVKYGKDFNDRKEQVNYEMWLLTNKQTKVQQHSGTGRYFFGRYYDIKFLQEKERG